MDQHFVYCIIAKAHQLKGNKILDKINSLTIPCIEVMEITRGRTFSSFT